MPSFNPFHSLPNRREVLAWGTYDLANQSFQLLINTLLFPIYFGAIVASSPARGEMLWGAFVAGAMLLVVLLSPVVGAIADARDWRRELLLGSGIVCAALTGTLALLGPGMVLWAALLYIPAAIACGLGENFLGSFLPRIATPATMGRISAIGWTMSYVGAILLLGISAAVVFGLGIGDAPRQWRWLFVFAGVWFAAGMLPAVFVLQEPGGPASPAGAGSILGAALRRLRQTVHEAPRYGHLFRFLGIFFVYSLGTQCVIYFSSVIGKNLGFELPQLILFALEMALTAGLGAVFAARYQDRLGHVRTVRLYLAVWVLSTLGLAFMHALSGAAWVFWIVVAGIGLGLGGIGTASRALVGAFTPPEKSAEFFGLWGMVYKFAGVLGPVTFALVSTRQPREVWQGVSLFMLAGFFAAGWVLMKWVRVPKAGTPRPADMPKN